MLWDTDELNQIRPEPASLLLYAVGFSNAWSFLNKGCRSDAHKTAGNTESVGAWKNASLTSGTGTIQYG